MPVNTSLEPVSGWLEAHRMVKSEAEIELIRRSVATNSKAFESAARRIRPGMRERDSGRRNRPPDAPPGRREALV
jgi:Xaa-Pro aminopeptidase